MKLLIDINLLPEEYKDDSGKVTAGLIKKYNRDYNVEIIPYDSSPHNTQGNNINTPQIIH